MALIAAAGMMAATLGGCPSTNTKPVTAKITISATSGPPPLLVAVSGGLSSSTAGTITDYAWDFGDNTTADGSDTTHTFAHPGRFEVQLTATDAAGNQGVDRVEVQVPGQTPTAKIVASTLSGPAPLTVLLDGTMSSAPDDTIYDYYWDFGDGQTSRASKPTHIYTGGGDFTVRLRVVTGGGVEAAAQTVIQVSGGGTGHSLQFNGTQLATLPVSSTATLTAFAIEAWAKPDGNDGTIVSVSAPVTQLQYLATSSTLRFRYGTATVDAASQNLVGGWHNVAASYDGSTVTLYVDGISVGSAALAAASLSVTQVVLGDSFHGKISDVRVWGAARSATQVASDVTTSVTGSEAGLLSAWPLNEGAGQILFNKAPNQTYGVLGTSTDTDTTDPAWSTDAP